mgnify:CR=1 FL=1
MRFDADVLFAFDRSDLSAQAQQVLESAIAEIEAAGELGRGLFLFDKALQHLPQFPATLKREGASVKGNGLQAVYVKGRVTYDATALDGVAAVYPAILAFREEKEPTVQIRRGK